MDMNYNDLEKITELLKIIAHPVRLCIVKGLIENGGCNVSKIQNCLRIPQSTVSQHLQKLKAAKIINGQRCGLEITYTVCDIRAERLVRLITKLYER